MVTLKHYVYLVGVKALARVGWWMQRPLIKLQREMLEHPMDVSDEEVESFLDAVREPRSTDTPVSLDDVWRDAHPLFQRQQSQPRTLDVSTEEIKSWPKVVRQHYSRPLGTTERLEQERQARLEAQQKVERVRQTDLEQEREHDKGGLPSDVIPQVDRPLSPKDYFGVPEPPLSDNREPRCDCPRQWLGGGAMIVDHATDCALRSEAPQSPVSGVISLVGTDAPEPPVCPSCGAVAASRPWGYETLHLPSCTWMPDTDAGPY